MNQSPFWQISQHNLERRQNPVKQLYVAVSDSLAVMADLSMWSALRERGADLSIAQDGLKRLFAGMDLPYKHIGVTFVSVDDLRHNKDAKKQYRLFKKSKSDVGFCVSHEDEEKLELFVALEPQRCIVGELSLPQTSVDAILRLNFYLIAQVLLAKYAARYRIDTDEEYEDVVALAEEQAEALLGEIIDAFGPPFAFVPIELMPPAK